MEGTEYFLYCSVWRVLSIFPIAVCPVEGTVPEDAGVCTMVGGDKCHSGYKCARQWGDMWHACCREQAPPSCTVSYQVIMSTILRMAHRIGGYLPIFIYHF